MMAGGRRMAAAALLALAAADGAGPPRPPLVLEGLKGLLVSPPIGAGKFGVPLFSLSCQAPDNATVVYFAPAWTTGTWGDAAQTRSNIRIARSTDGGFTWRIAGRQATAPPIPPASKSFSLPLVTPLPGGREALLLYNFYPNTPSTSIAEWNGTALTWPEQLTEMYPHPTAEDGITHPILRLESGRLLHVGDGPGLGVGAVYSDTGGRSWKAGGFSACHQTPYGCGGEPAAVELANKTVWVLTRRAMVDWSPDEGEAVLMQAWSDDGGATFRGPQVPSRFISYGAPPTLLRLRRNVDRFVSRAAPDFDRAPIVIIYNNARQLSRFDGGTEETARSILHAAISLDGGRSWRGHREVLRDPELKLKNFEGSDHGVGAPPSLCSQPPLRWIPHRCRRLGGLIGLRSLPIFLC